MSLHYPTVLSIAGSDPSGGAGIQADIKTCSALGCYAMAVITSLTAQNTHGVKSVFDTTGFVANQLTALLDDIHPDAVKTGMLGAAQSVSAIIQAIESYNLSNIVVDTVMASTSGHKLSSNHMTKLLPYATIVTPNIDEAQFLSGIIIDTPERSAEAAAIIKQRYSPQAVLVKGGHFSRPVDTLLIGNEITTFDSQHIDTCNTHGTGCTLSSAIASYLAKGFDIKQSVTKAKQYLNTALTRGAQYQIGSGQGAMNHIYHIIDNPI